MVNLFICCFGISHIAFYLFNNIIDLLLVSGIILNNYSFDNKMHFSKVNFVLIFNIFSFIIFISCLIYFIIYKKYRTALHRNYARIKLIYIFIDLYSCINVIYFNIIKKALNPKISTEIKINLFNSIFLLTLHTWNIYLSFYLIKIICNDYIEEKEELIEKEEISFSEKSNKNILEKPKNSVNETKPLENESTIKKDINMVNEIKIDK